MLYITAIQCSKPAQLAMASSFSLWLNFVVQNESENYTASGRCKNSRVLGVTLIYLVGQVPALLIGGTSILHASARLGYLLCKQRDRVHDFNRHILCAQPRR